MLEINASFTNGETWKLGETIHFWIGVECIEHPKLGGCIPEEDVQHVSIVSFMVVRMMTLRSVFLRGDPLTLPQTYSDLLCYVEVMNHKFHLSSEGRPIDVCLISD